MPALRLSFGTPHHGWVEVKLESDAHVVEFIASDVPNNPIQQLVDGIDRAARGEEAIVWWHLEPDGYYFNFLPTPLGVELRIDHEGHAFRGTRHEVAVVRGTRAQVLVPMWRALRRFESLQHQEPHWPPVDYRCLPSVREALRE